MERMDKCAITNRGSRLSFSWWSGRPVGPGMRVLIRERLVSLRRVHWRLRALLTVETGRYGTVLYKTGNRTKRHIGWVRGCPR